MEPSRKVKKTEDHEFKAMFGVVQDMFLNKLQSIEEKIEKISSKYLSLEKKVDMIISSIQKRYVDVSCTTSPIEDSASENSTAKDDFPNGSWLGDPDNPEFRFRSPIKQKDLEYINNHCRSAERMSLMLLDYLFPREVQACSNISGLGKHNKKQLDPCKIQGIMYHVMYKFGITEKDWNRIKLNIDSKCRTIFRRKVKGLPVNVRGKRGRPFYKINRETDDSNGCDLSPLPNSLNPDSDIFNQSVEPRSDEENSASEAHPDQIESISPFTFSISATPEIIDMEQGRIKVIHATKEQFELLKQDPSIHILHESEQSS